MILPALKELPLFFLYFLFYSFLGWMMETIYCSLLARRFVMRGFLLGPVCPIYGVGALLMILLFSRFQENLVLFYLVATLSMSAWEYFVGWLLETTTHIKYWDYSHLPLNIHGRICIPICLWWGLLAYATVFWVHPAVSAGFLRIPPLPRNALAAILFLLLTADTVTTIRKLALTAKLISKAEELRQELADRAERARQGLLSRAEETRDGLLEKVDDVLRERPDLEAARAKLEARYRELLSRAEYHSRRFRRRYTHMSSARFTASLEQVQQLGSQLRDRLLERRKNRRNIRKH